MQTIRQPTLRDFAKLTTLGAIWASAFLCIEIALVDFSPFAIACWRIGLGTAALAPFVLWHRRTWPSGPGTWGLIALAGLLYNAVPFTLISWGQQHITSGMAAILMSCGPFMALILSHLLTRDDRFTLSKLSGVLLGFTGVLVLIGAQALQGSTGAIAGQLAMVTAVTCYVLSSLIIRRIDGSSPLVISFAILATSAVYMVPLLFMIGEPVPDISQSSSVVALIFLALVPTALAYTLRVQIVQQVGATFLAQVSFIIPLFGLFWSWLFLAQIPDASIWLALTLILAGLLANHLARRG